MKKLCKINFLQKISLVIYYQVMIRINFSKIYLMKLLYYFLFFSVGVCFFSSMFIFGFNLLSFILVICFILFFFLKTHKQMCISDLFITDNELIFVYKYKKEVIEKVIPKNDIKSFKVYVERQDNHRCRFFNYNINIETKNSENFEFFQYELCECKLLFDLLKYRTIIPQFSYNIKSTSLNKIADYYINKNRLPIGKKFSDFCNLIILIILILILEYILFAPFCNIVVQKLLNQ